MNTEENKPEPTQELTPELQKIVAAAVAQALAQHQSGTGLPTEPARKSPVPNPVHGVSAPKGLNSKWGPRCALHTCLTRYANFSGRASRSEYWYAVLANSVIMVILPALLGLAIWLTDSIGVVGTIFAILFGLLLLAFNLLMLVPGLAVTVRRMHDIGRSGWAICFYLIPLVGPIILLILLLSPSGAANQYGAAPALPAGDDEKAPAFVAWLLKNCHNSSNANLNQNVVAVADTGSVERPHALKTVEVGGAPKGTPGKWAMWLALRTSLTRYANFSGRASRSEYWYAVLANSVIMVILQALLGVAIWLTDSIGVVGTIFAILFGLLLLAFNLLMLVPGLAVTVRRMHDIGRSGWAICFYLIPLVGPIILLILLLSPSGAANQYGAAPALPAGDDEKAPAFVAWLLKNCHNSSNANLNQNVVAVADTGSVERTHALKTVEVGGDPKGTPGKWAMWRALRTSLTRYADFSGRASRSEFWYTVLANYAVVLILQILVGLGIWLAECTGTPGVIIASVFGLLLLSFNILMLVPGLAVTVRRMHDIGRSGWAICFYLIPLVGPIIFLIFLLRLSGAANQYGKAPNHPVSDDEKAPAIVAWLVKTCRALFVDHFGKTMLYVGGAVSAIAVLWVGLLFLLAPANPLKPLYDEGILNENNVSSGAQGKFNRAYQQYLAGEIQITDYPFVIALIDLAVDQRFTLPVAVMEDLVEAGADVNASYSEFYLSQERTWFSACKLGDPAILRYLVSVGVENCDYNYHNSTAFYLREAVKSHSVEMVRALVEVGCNVDFRRDDSEYTALMVAVNSGDSEIIKLLAEHRADFNAYIMNGSTKVTVYDLAARRSPEILSLVESLGALPSQAALVARLCEIADKGDLEAFNAMKAKGYDLVSLSKQTNSQGYTPLMIAARSASVDMVNAMIAAGFDVNAKGASGDTPLMSASIRAGVVKALLDAGADVSDVNNEGKTALFRAVDLNATESIRMLAQAGADIKGGTIDNHSYLTYAAANGKCQSIRVLVELGAEVNAPDADGKTPLYRAAKADESEAVKTLTELGANTNPSSNDGSVAPALMHGKLLVMDYSSAEHATVETDVDTVQVAHYEAVPAGSYGTGFKETLKTYKEGDYSIILGAYERKSSNSAEYAVLGLASGPSKPLLKKLGNYLYLMPHRRLSSMLPMCGDGADTYYLHFTSPAGGTAKRVLEASCETTYVRNISFTVIDDPSVAPLDLSVRDVQAPIDLDGSWMKLTHADGVVWFYCTDGKIYRCNAEIGDTMTAPAEPSRFKDVSQGSGYMFKDDLGRPYSAVHEFSYTPSGNTALLFMRVETIKRTFMACFDGEKDYANDIVTYDGKPMKITFTANNNGVVSGYCEGVWGMAEFGEPYQTISITIYTDGVDNTYAGAQSVVGDDFDALQAFINGLIAMNPKDATQKLYRKRLLTLLPKIARGGDVNMTLKETKGNTALHYACGMGHVELVTWLVQHGADVTKKTDKGKTPLDCAGGDVSAVRAALQSPGAAASDTVSATDTGVGPACSPLGLGSVVSPASALEGRFYDLKKKVNGKSSGLNGGMANQSGVIVALSKFFKNWNAAELNKYYKSETKLYASNWYLPSAMDKCGPIAFQMGDPKVSVNKWECQPSAWLAV